MRTIQSTHTTAAPTSNGSGWNKVHDYGISHQVSGGWTAYVIWVDSMRKWDCYLDGSANKTNEVQEHLLTNNEAQVNAWIKSRQLPAPGPIGKNARLQGQTVD